MSGSSTFTYKYYFIYSIPTGTFIDITNQLIEIFPILERNSLYIPHTPVTDESSGLTESGTLYNYYRDLRKEYRLAGLLSESSKSKNKKAKSTGQNKESTFISLIFYNVVIVSVIINNYYIVSR